MLAELPSNGYLAHEDWNLRRSREYIASAYGGVRTNEPDGVSLALQGHLLTNEPYKKTLTFQIFVIISLKVLIIYFNFPLIIRLKHK